MKLITSIEDLTLAQFIDCVCDNKLSVLVVEGEADWITLLECWSNLYAQYLDILGDTETLYLINLQKEIELLNFKVTATTEILNLFDLVGEVAGLVLQLKAFGFKDTRQARARMPHMRLKLAEKQAEIAGYQRDKSTDTVNRMFFSKQLARLSKHQGYPIRVKETLVPEYVAILRDYLSQYLKTTSPQDGKER